MVDISDDKTIITTAGDGKPHVIDMSQYPIDNSYISIPTVIRLDK